MLIQGNSIKNLDKFVLLEITVTLVSEALYLYILVSFSKRGACSLTLSWIRCKAVHFENQKFQIECVRAGIDR
jgi:hypothetical protein